MGNGYLNRIKNQTPSVDLLQMIQLKERQKDLIEQFDLVKGFLRKSGNRPNQIKVVKLMEKKLEELLEFI